MELSKTQGQSPGPSHRLVQIMRLHPLLYFFLLAFGLTWACELPVLLLWHPSDPYHGMAPILLLGPAFSALLMTVVVEGKPGVGRLLRRYALWRVGLRWYVLVLLGIPALILLSALTVPGAAATFRAPAPPLYVKLRTSPLDTGLEQGYTCSRQLLNVPGKVYSFHPARPIKKARASLVPFLN